MLYNDVVDRTCGIDASGKEVGPASSAFDLEAQADKGRVLHVQPVRSWPFTRTPCLLPG